MLTLVSFHLLL